MPDTSGQTDKRRLCRTIVRLVVAVVLAVTVAAFAAGCGGQISEAQKAEEAGDLGKAATLYQEQLDAHPDDLVSVKALAGILYMQRRWNDALPVQEKAVAMDPKEAQIRVELGFNYLNHQKAADKAVAVLAEAAALEHTAQRLSFLAQAQKAAGDKIAAEASLREALKVDKTYAFTYDLLVSLLSDQGKTAEADQVRQAAAAASVTLQSETTAK